MVSAACYITGGDSECGDMVSFFRRINDKIEYFQRCPNKPKYRKKGTESCPLPEGISHVKDSLRGLTGSDLISFVAKDIREHFVNTHRPFNFDMILIEDDADFRFLDGSFETKIKEYERTIRDVLKDTTGTNANIPIYFLYASPELEIWFLADWEHSFRDMYCAKMNRSLGMLYSNRLHKYIFDHFFPSLTHIEDYSHPDYCEKELAKLSKEIERAAQHIAIELNYELSKNGQNGRGIDDSVKLQYSKKFDGAKMLSQIVPQQVASKCSKYFSPVYEKIQAYGVSSHEGKIAFLRDNSRQER